MVDFRRDKNGVPAKVAAIEYDPNRSARLALLHYADGDKRYILCPEGLKVGATVATGEGADILGRRKECSVDGRLETSYGLKITMALNL